MLDGWEVLSLSLSLYHMKGSPIHNSWCAFKFNVLANFIGIIELYYNNLLIYTLTLPGLCQTNRPSSILYLSWLRMAPMLDWYIGECMVTTTKMVSKNLPISIKIIIIINYWYLVDILKWENICTPKLLFLSILITSLNHIDSMAI